MKTWDEFFPSTLYHLPECPLVVVRDALRGAAIELCQESFIWNDEYTITVTPEDREVELADVTADQADLVMLLTATWQPTGEHLQPRTQKWLTEQNPLWQSESGSPVYFTAPVQGNIMWLAPHPDATGIMSGMAAFKPKQDATGVPDQIYRDYNSVISAGAVASLMLIPNKPWTSTQLSQVHGATFAQGKNTALLWHSRSNVRAPIRTKVNYRF